MNIINETQIQSEEAPTTEKIKMVYSADKPLIPRITLFCNGDITAVWLLPTLPEVGGEDRNAVTVVG